MVIISRYAGKHKAISGYDDVCNRKRSLALLSSRMMIPKWLVYYSGSGSSKFYKVNHLTDLLDTSTLRIIESMTTTSHH